VIALRLIAMTLQNPTTPHPSSSKKQKVQGITLSVKEWEEMLLGQKEIISKENEEKVIDILQNICKEVRNTNKNKKTRLLADCNLEQVITSTHIDIKQSAAIVASLLEEEILIAQLFEVALCNGITDW